MNRLLIALLFGVLGFSACMQEEGCLDASATNFAPGADRDCADDCCEYPKLDLRFFTEIDADSFYTDANTGRFRVDDLRFFISNVQLLQSDGTLVGVSDLVTIEPAGDVVEDNYTIGDFNSFSYEVGDVAGYGDFVGVRFDIGLDAVANTAVPEQMPDAHSLGIQEDTMYVSADEGYAFQKIDLSIIADADTTSQAFNVLGDENLVSLSLTDTFTLARSFDVEIQMDVDYVALFAGIDFEADDEALIIEKIVTNTPNIFSIR